MYRHLKVTSMSEMNDEIINFLADLLGISRNTNIIKITSKNGNNMVWFVKDPSRGGLSIWIGDVSQLGNPWENDATVGAAGKYQLDMWRKEIDAGKTAAAKSKLKAQNQKGYDLLLERAQNADEYRDAYLIWYYNNLKINEDIEEYKDVCYRKETTNIFHLGGLLKYDEVTPSGNFKWLDCLYNDGTFMFSLYGNMLPWVTRNLIVGELDTYINEISGKTYIMSNSWILKSYIKDGSYNDSFFLEDIVGEDRIPSQQSAISLGNGNILDSYIDNYKNCKTTEETKKKDMDDKKDIWDKKLDDANRKRASYLIYKQTAIQARAAADAETDPTAKQAKDVWATTLEQETNKLDAEATQLENDANIAEQDYMNARNDWLSSQSATEAAFNAAKNVYVNVLSKTILAVGIKDNNLNHHVADCPEDEQVITYNNDIFCAYRLDVDNDAVGDADYSYNGHATAFHLHTAPEGLHLRYYDTSAKYYPPETMTTPVLYGWEHQLLHYTYESYESDVGANIYPMLDTTKKRYEIYDSLEKKYKPFQCFSRSGTGGNSVNNMNNISTVIPLIFYIERDDEQIHTWSAVGQTTIVNYVNMYNMGTGTMFHSQQHDCENLYGCYNLWRRRMETTPWNPVINDDYSEWKEVWGFGGYVGIAFKTTVKDDLDDLRRRVVV